jgi:hypothetical protein
MNVLRRPAEITGVKRTFSQGNSRIEAGMSAFPESGRSDIIKIANMTVR